MAHHSPTPIADDTFRKLFQGEGPGPTGQFPEGKLTADDEGEIRYAVAADRERQKVVIDFGAPVRWVGMTPDQADHLGRLLIAKGGEARPVLPAEGMSEG